MNVYNDLIERGAQMIMLSHSSVNGVKMHENKQYIDYLKNDLGFEGFIVSNWNSIQNTSGKTYEEQLINCVNARVDMLMEVDDFAEAISVAQALGKPIIACVVTGRQVIIEEYYNSWDAVVMCYLPGSEGQGITDVLCCETDFKGKLPSPWYSSTNQIKTEECWLPQRYGLNYEN